MPNKEQYIIYFGHFELPDKNALAHRVRTNVNMIRSYGIRGILIGYTRNLPVSFAESDNEQYEIRYPETIKEWIQDNSSYKYIERILLDKNPDLCKAIIATGVGAGNTLGMIHLSKKYGVPYISDIVDWILYSKNKYIYNAIKFFYEYLICSRLVQCRVKNRIFISSYIATKYNNKGRNTIIIPSLTYSKDDRFDSLPRYVAKDHIELCYAGNPGRKGAKDRIDWCVMAFNDLAPDNAVLNIYGINRETFEKDFPEVDINHKGIVFHGSCSNSICLKSIACSDYFIFAREDTEITKSGFPTKFSEALAIGTPVITTPTSDLKLYLKNGYNGFISEECSYRSLSKIMKEAFSLDATQRTALHYRESPLDESLWRNRFKAFFDRLI